MPRTAIEFKNFWDAYALKRDKLAAERVWKRMSDRDRRAALAGIAAYREDCERQGIRMMYPQGYLSHRRWEDEFTSPAVEEIKVAPRDAKPSVPQEMDLW